MHVRDRLKARTPNTQSGRCLSLAFVLGLAAGTGPAGAEWEDDLQLQIESEKQCKAVSISNVVEFTTDGHNGLTATVECEDGRYFQASRDRPLRAFILTGCKDERACLAIRHKKPSN